MPKKHFEIDETTKAISALVITFEDETSLRFEASSTSPEIQVRAMWHGFSQKLGDSYANAGKAENPLAFAKEAVADVIAQLSKGDWRAAAGEGGPRVTDLAVAMSRVTGKTVEEVVAFLEGQDEDQKKVWRKKPKIAAEIAKIAAEKAIARANKLMEDATKAVAEKPGEEITLG